jgi:nucleoside recognition membrane protein YjiH
MDFVQDILNFIKLAWSFLPVFICICVTAFILIKYNRNYVVILRIRHPTITSAQINSAITIIGLVAIFNFWPNNHAQETEQELNQEYTWDSK